MNPLGPNSGEGSRVFLELGGFDWENNSVPREIRMLIFPFISHLQIIQMAPQRPQVPPSIEVVIRGSVIQLPDLPERINQAHAEYGKIGPCLKRDLKDLEQNLIDLYVKQDHHAPLPSHLKVSKKSADLVKFLVQMINDDHYAELERKVLFAWQEWQNALVEQGLAEWVPGTFENIPSVIPSTPISEKEKKELNIRRAGMEKSGSLLDFEKRLRIAMTTLTTNGGGSMNPRVYLPENTSSLAMGQFAAHVDESVTTSRSVMLINERKAPSLSEKWKPFATYLNECARKLNDQEAISSMDQDPDIRNLKIQAKLHFLERYRSALWFCSVVWARMAAETPPPPLRELEQEGVKE